MDTSGWPSPARPRMRSLHHRGRGDQGKCSCAGRASIEPASSCWLYVGPWPMPKSRWGTEARDREHPQTSNDGHGQEAESPWYGFWGPILCFFLNDEREQGPGRNWHVNTHLLKPCFHLAECQKRAAPAAVTCPLPAHQPLAACPPPQQKSPHPWAVPVTASN